VGSFRCVRTQIRTLTGAEGYTICQPKAVTRPPQHQPRMWRGVVNDGQLGGSRRRWAGIPQSL